MPFRKPLGAFFIRRTGESGWFMLLSLKRERGWRRSPCQKPSAMLLARVHGPPSIHDEAESSCMVGGVSNVAASGSVPSSDSVTAPSEIAFPGSRCVVFRATLT